ncbi:MAG: cytochrome P450 [Anaerolineales bacterium]
MTLPPLLTGLPILGNAHDVGRDAVDFLESGYRQLGPVYRFRLANRPAVALIGPDHNRFVLENTDRLFTMQDGYRFLIPMFGQRVFFVAGHEEYKEQKALMLPAFRGRMMAKYIEVMQRETERWMDELGDEGSVDIVAAFERLTMYIAAGALLGEAFRERLGDHFAALYRDLAAGIEYLLPPNLPLPRFIRRDRAKRKLEQMITALIAERRADPTRYNDFLQIFLESTYSDGSPAPDEVILALVMGLVFAGHETTAGHASWGLVRLLQHPEYLGRVQQEIDRALGTDPVLAQENLRDLDHLDWALRETERTDPVARLLIRTTMLDVEVDGYMIPKGWTVFLSPAVSHKMPEIFSEPQRWDPMRYSPGREEDRRHPYALTGFGGGPHKCLGMNFAYTEMKVIFSLLLARYDLELVDPDPKTDRSPATSRPQRPCLVRYRSREALPAPHGGDPG